MKNAIDLFAGAGGLTIALQETGFNVVFANEINHKFAETHHYNFPSIPLIEKDIKDIDADQISSILQGQKVNLVAGGPPCQGFSIFGKRRFINTLGYNPRQDPRNFLVYEFIRIVDLLQPEFFFMENVKGFTNLDNGLFIKEVEKEFHKIGYSKIWCEIICAADYGVPQERYRMFMIGNRIGVDYEKPNPSHFPTGSGKYPEYLTVKDAIFDLIGKENTIPNHVPLNHKPIVAARYSYVKEGEKLKFYRQIGINRLSMGVQSLNNKQLKKIGRLHNKKQVFQALKNAKNAGFENISCDFLLGLEKSSFIKIKSMLKKIKNKVKHLSCYMLQVENGTKLEKMLQQKEIVLPNEEKTIKVYNKIVKYLEKHGFDRYEISNFAKKGYQCLHNLKYWTRENYIGFGLSAHSLYKNKRWSNANDFENYFKGDKPYIETLTNDKIIEEIIMLGLRCEVGFNIKDVLKLGYDITKNQNFNEYLKENILIKEGDKIKINPKYYGVNNYIIANIL